MFTETKTEINFSMGNLVDASAPWALAMPIEFYSFVAQQSGYSGIEYFPYRVPHIQIRSGMFSDFALNSIKSVHQSYRTEKSLKEVKEHPNPVLALQAYMTLAEKVDSLKDLEKLQTEEPGIPAIVYPPNEWSGETRPTNFDRLSNKLIQPAPELLGGWGVNSAEQFVDEAIKRDYELCLDLYHIRRLPVQGFETKFAPWQELLPVFLPKTREIHLSVGRTDFRGPFNSVQELEDLYYGDERTEIIPMLAAIRNFGWSGPIVTEIPASSASRLVSKITTPGSIIKIHSRIVENVGALLGVYD